MSFNKLCCLVVLLGLLGPVGSVQSAESKKWAYVDLQKAMRSTEKGKKAYQELVNMKDERQKTLEKEEGQLKSEGEALKKQRGVLSEDAFRRKGEEFAKKQFDFQKKVEQYEGELYQAQNGYAKDILVDMQKIIQDMGKNENYEIIFEKASSSLLYADSTYDLTDKLIELYNKRGDSSKKK